MDALLFVTAANSESQQSSVREPLMTFNLATPGRRLMELSFMEFSYDLEIDEGLNVPNIRPIYQR